MSKSAAQLPFIAIAIVATSSVAALLGWAFDLEPLKTWNYPGAPPMNPLSAIEFFLICLAMLTLPSSWPTKKIFGGLSGALALIALAQWTKFVPFEQPSIDQMAFGAKLMGNSMAPNSIIAFLFISTAVFLRTDRRFAELTTILTISVMWISFLAVIGYLYSVKGLYNVFGMRPMALNTAVAFFALSLGVLFLDLDREPVRTFVSESKGGYIARKLIPSAIFFPVLTGWLRLKGEQAHFFDAASGVALFAAANVVVSVYLLWTTTRTILKMDIKTQYLVNLLTKKAKVDPLTGLWNRGYVDERLNSESALFERYGSYFSCVLLDVDYFKKINDTYGHTFGDFILKKVATLLLACCRREDVVCRYGGEEFFIILPSTKKTQAAHLAERIRKTIEAHEFTEGDVTAKVTCSFGVTESKLDDKNLVERADAFLYRAKSSGRNCVIIDDDVVTDQVA